MTGHELTGYKLTPKAERDLEDIWLYTAGTWSPDQADIYVEGLLHTIGTLVALQPAMARERVEFVPAVRIHPNAEHLIVYRVDVGSLLIVRILGGRQNWRAILEAVDS